MKNNLVFLFFLISAGCNISNDSNNKLNRKIPISNYFNKTKQTTQNNFKNFGKLFSKQNYNKGDENIIEYNRVNEIRPVDLDNSKKNTKEYSEETKMYFNEIAYGREFDNDTNVLYKWESNILIYVDGEKNQYLIDELNRVIEELNEIIIPIKLKIVKSLKESNFVVFFGDHITFHKRYKLFSPEKLEHNMGYFELYYGSGVMYVDLYRNTDKISHKHLIREELTQSLGLVNDSDSYPESIFFQGWTKTNEYTKIDIELIELLYNY